MIFWSIFEQIWEHVAGIFDELVDLLPDPSALRFLRDFLQELLPGILPAFCQLGIYLQKVVLSGSQLSQV